MQGARDTKIIKTYPQGTEPDRAPERLSYPSFLNSGFCVITYHSHSALAFLLLGMIFSFSGPWPLLSYSLLPWLHREQRSLGMDGKLSCNQRCKDQSWQRHWSSGFRDFLFKIKIPDDPNIGKWVPAEHSVFCADSRKEAGITTEATLFHSFQPCGLDANCHPNSEIAFQNMVKHKTAKSIKH